MRDISKPLTTGKAKTYYQQEYSVASNNYLSQGQTLTGHARGPLAEALGLSTEITPEQFERLMEGQHPITGEQLIRHKDTVKTRDGRELGHRAGWDVTINAAKSVMRRRVSARLLWSAAMTPLICPAAQAKLTSASA
jgi:conjugative relaxase-like TrwC/TraI family protein